MKHETRKIAYNHGYHDGWKDAAELALTILREDVGEEELVIERLERELGLERKRL